MSQTLAAADPVAALLAWLRSHPDVLDTFGDPAQVSGRNESPYPRLMIAPGQGGSDRDLRWLLAPEVVLVTYGAPDGTPGQSALRRMHYTALEAAVALPNRVFGPAESVVSAVRSTAAARWAVEPLTGQPSWHSSLVVTIHPPAVPA